jgi:hypothetical protein
MDIRRLGIALGVACAYALVAAGASAASTSPGVCLAATGSNGWCGDGFPATRAKLAVPRDIAPLPGGGFLIADSANHVIRRVDGRGAITTIAGTGTAGHPVYGRRASASFLGTPTGVAPLPGGCYMIADSALGEVDYKHRAISIRVRLYVARSQRRAPTPFAAPYRETSGARIDSPNRRSVQLLFLPDLRAEPTPEFLRVELIDAQSGSMLAVADSPELVRGRIRR